VSSTGSSIVAANKDKRLEVGLIGCKGLTGLPIMLGNDRSPNETVMQVAGNGIRIPADKLRDAIPQSQSLQRALLNFAQGFLNQTANTALSNGTATLEERLARWLLMAHDRLRGDEVPLTHEVLSLMLGVRRAGVTVALHNLAQRGLVRLSRSQVVITDRKGLKEAANGSYRKPHYSRLTNGEKGLQRTGGPCTVRDKNNSELEAFSFRCSRTGDDSKW
jgi:CRP-like cAMP-binding protein